MHEESRELPLPLERFRSWLHVIASAQLGPRVREKLDASDLV